MTALGILWFALIAVLIAGYFILDGFDLGAGILSPFIAKDENEKAVVRRAIGPTWDGNEVWLLTAGGALFAAFAPAYATTFSGFYLAIMLVLFGLIVRAVSLEYRAHDPKWGKVWDVLFFIGSLLPALLFGVAIGNVYAGIPLDANGDYAGIPLLGLITPFTLLCGLLGLSVFVTQGATWIALKAEKPSDLQVRAAKLRCPLACVTMALFVAVSVYALMGIAPTLDPSLGALRLGGLRGRGRLADGALLGFQGNGQRSSPVPGKQRIGTPFSGAVRGIDVPHPGSCHNRYEHHHRECRFFRFGPCVDDGHHLHWPPLGAGVPRADIPHLPWAYQRQ